MEIYMTSQKQMVLIPSSSNNIKELTLQHACRLSEACTKKAQRRHFVGIFCHALSYVTYLPSRVMNVSMPNKIWILSTLPWDTDDRQ